MSKILNFFVKKLPLIIALTALVSCSKTVLDTTKLEIPAPPVGSLTVAAFEGDVRLVSELLQKGAYIDENIGDETNQITPLMAAIANKQDEVAKLLVEKGATLYPTYNLFNATDLARYQNQFEVLRSMNRGQK